MSTVETEHQDSTERPERAVLHREFDAEFSPGAGRTLDIRIVPYGIAAEVSDFGGPRYREMWMHGAFADQVRGAEAGRAREVLVNFEHNQRSLNDVLGRGIMLREAQDGFYGSFELFDSPDADKALTLIGEGGVSGVSLEARAKKSVRGTDGVLRRVSAHLFNIALCRRPAYKAAAVLAVREETILDEAMLPVPIDMEMVERCRRLGIALPTRLREQLSEVERTRVAEEERLEREQAEAEQAAEEAAKPRRIEIERDESGRAVAYIEHK